MASKRPFFATAILATVGCANILGIDEGAVRGNADARGGAPSQFSASGATGGLGATNPAMGGNQGFGGTTGIVRSSAIAFVGGASGVTGGDKGSGGTSASAGATNGGTFATGTTSNAATVITGGETNIGGTLATSIAGSGGVSSDYNPSSGGIQATGGATNFGGSFASSGSDGVSTGGAPTTGETTSSTLAGTTAGGGTTGASGATSTGGTNAAGETSIAPTYCTIDTSSGTVVYPNDATNQDNVCLVCKPATSSIAWTANSGKTRSDGKACNNGACQTGCGISGTYYESGAASPNNPCLSCQPSQSNSGWSNVPTARCVTAVAAGYFHSCAVVNGGVRCWGLNNYGQLGVGSTNQFDIPSPVQVAFLTSGATAVNAGADHTCAVVNAEVQCWGNNANGESGYTAAQCPTPVHVVFP